MSIFGGASKDTEEWEDISRIITALQNGAPPPPVRTLIAEWRELGLALRALSVSGGTSDIFVTDNAGVHVVDSVGTEVTL
jgi:hypothetical protein